MTEESNAPVDSRTAPSKMAVTSSGDLARRTLRTALLLVGLCVAFVGTLSVVAVTVASRFVETSSSSSGARAVTERTGKPLSI